MRSEAVIALGKRLVDALDLDGDLTASWLSHLLAGRLSAVEEAAPEGRLAAEQACVGLILELWEHRSAFPTTARPFHEIEPLLAVIRLLDPDNPHQRYFSRPSRHSRPGSTPEPVDLWLDYAANVDRIARMLIHRALSEAVHAMGSDIHLWAELAEAVDMAEVPEGVIIRILTRGEPEISPERALTERRIEEVKGFINLAEALVRTMEGDLDAQDTDNDE